MSASPGAIFSAVGFAILTVVRLIAVFRKPATANRKAAKHKPLEKPE